MGRQEESGRLEALRKEDVSIRIKRNSADGNVFKILAYLADFRRQLNRNRIPTPLIDTFLDEQQFMNMTYEEVIKKVEELSHDCIKVID